MNTLIFWLIFPLVYALEAPGTSEEVYCCEGYCLQQRQRKHGFTGSRVQFLYCCNNADRDRHVPRTWGKDLDPEYRARLLADGWKLMRPSVDDCRMPQCAPTTALDQRPPIQGRHNIIMQPDVPVGLFRGWAHYF